MKLPRTNRITRRADFKRVRLEGSSFAGRYLVMGCLHDPSLDVPLKLGLITTKKLGNAVARNRFRRRFRGIVQRHGEMVAPGYWMVIIARRFAAEATSAQLEKEWRWMLRRCGMLVAAKPVVSSRSSAP